jgi:hypothetical protein
MSMAAVLPCAAPHYFTSPRHFILNFTQAIPSEFFCPYGLHSNGEIYNHEKILKKELGGHMGITSHSDCAVIGPLYQKYGHDFGKVASKLDGMFAAILFDRSTGEFFACRDHMGIASMYWGKDKDGAMWFASEMKALQHNCVEYAQFPPVSPLLLSFSLYIPCLSPLTTLKCLFSFVLRIWFSCHSGSTYSSVALSL